MRRFSQLLAILIMAAVFLVAGGDTVRAESGHQFFGSALTGSAAVVDGELAHNGAIIAGFDQDGNLFGVSPICKGVWVIELSDPRSVKPVHFSITTGNDGSTFSEDIFPIHGIFRGGRITEVALVLQSGGSDPVKVPGLDCRVSSDLHGNPS